MGRRPRCTGLQRRKETSGRRLLSRQYFDRRANADAEGAPDRRPHVRDLAAWNALPLLEGQQVPGVRPRGRNVEDARQWCGGQLRRR